MFEIFKSLYEIQKKIDYEKKAYEKANKKAERDGKRIDKLIKEGRKKGYFGRFL